MPDVPIPRARRELVERVIAVSGDQLFPGVRSSLSATQRGQRTTYSDGATADSWAEVVIDLVVARDSDDEGAPIEVVHTARMTVASPDLIPGLTDLLEQVELALGTGVVHQG